MNDVIEVSYTGDLLAHRRCPRAWAYEKHAGFVPYEQVQAMEGRLLHHGDQPARQHRQHRQGDARLLLEQRREVLAADREAAGLGRRADARDAMRIRHEQGELAYELARAELGLEAAARLDGDGPLLDDVHAGAGVVGLR